MAIHVFAMEILLISKALLLMSVTSSCASFSSGDMKNLLHHLTSGYDPTLRPIYNQSKPIMVHVEFMIVSLTEMNAVDQTIKLETYFKLTWTDEFLTWEPSIYNGVDVIYPYSNSIWMPSINLLNSLEINRVALTDMDTKYPILVNSSGEVNWILPATLFTSCSMDMTYFPNDEQTCNFYISFNGYTWKDAQFVTDTAMNDTIPINVTDGQWTFVNYAMGTGRFPFIRVDKSGMGITVTLKRLPEFFTIHLLFPTTSLSFLNVIVFILPVESGEKVSYSITVLLSVMLYQSSASSYLPATSINTPLVIRFLTALSCISIISVIATLATVYVHHWEEKLLKQEVGKSAVSRENSDASSNNAREKTCNSVDVTLNSNGSKVGPSFKIGPVKKSVRPNDECTIKKKQLLMDTGSIDGLDNDLHSKQQEEQMFKQHFGFSRRHFIRNINKYFFIIFLTVWCLVTFTYLLVIFI